MPGMITIASPDLSADIDPQGAQLYALRDAEGRDLQWNGDPAVWTGRAPILFPIVGAVAGGRYRLDGQAYALGRHGFARQSLFEVVAAGPARAVLRLRWSEETLKAYPFRFELDLAFALDAATLSVTAAIRNLDDQPLPASFGYHPALLWPLPYGQPRADHAIVFQHDEPAPIRRLDAEGLVLPQPVPTPVEGRTLPLRDALFADDALVFDRLASRRVRYGAKAGPSFDIAFPDAPYLGVWTKPGGGYICIEPWWGHADPEGFTGDFRDKPGVFMVEPGQARDCAMTLTLVEPS